MPILVGQWSDSIFASVQLNIFDLEIRYHINTLDQLAA